MTQLQISLLVAGAFAVLVAFGVPVLLVALRHEVRVGRLRILDQFDHIFAVSDSTDGDDDDDDDDAGGPSKVKPSFEYVRQKYMEDIPEAPVPLAGDAAPQPDYKRCRSFKWWQLGSSRVLLFSALPYMLICAAGILLLLLCLGPAPYDGVLASLCRPLGLMGGAGLTDPAKLSGYFLNVLTVAGMAFLGAYLFSLGILSRALATFDLSPITFVRVSINMLTAVVAVLVAFRTFPDFLAQAKSLFFADAATDAATSSLPRAWFLVAFTFGLVPDLAINWLIDQLQKLLGYKPPKNAAFGTRSVPLSVIDGIDFFTRFRLQQANIYEVQNLAVANPIMMFVETPYGIYQCVDWVAQAQLCTAVGPDRFLAMRRYNIRTIFDLERALLSRGTTSQMRRFVAALMLSTPPEPDAEGWKFWSLKRGQPPPAPGDVVGSAAFGQYAADLFAQPAEGTDGRAIANDPDRTLKHLGRIVVDDLHVHRLRQIWKQIGRRLDASNARLPDTEREP